MWLDLEVLKDVAVTLGKLMASFGSRRPPHPEDDIPSRRNVLVAPC